MGRLPKRPKPKKPKQPLSARPPQDAFQQPAGRVLASRPYGNRPEQLAAAQARAGAVRNGLRDMQRAGYWPMYFTPKGN